jgi:hypothetical protein
MHPYHTSGGASKLHTHIHQILKNNGVDPVTNKKVLGGPLDVSSMNCVVFNMVKKIKATKDHSE